MFEEIRLCDVMPINMVPTWRKFGVGEEGVSKSLDRFMVVERVMEEA
jgi:hypothetical protein